MADVFGTEAAAPASIPATLDGPTLDVPTLDISTVFDSIEVDSMARPGT